MATTEIFRSLHGDLPVTLTYDSAKGGQPSIAIPLRETPRPVPPTPPAR